MTDTMTWDRFHLLRWRLEAGYDREVSLKSGNRSHFVDTCCVGWLLRSGSVRVRGGGHTLTAGPGQWVVADSAQPRDQRFEPGTRILSIRFRLWWTNLPGLPIPGLPATIAADRVPRLESLGLAVVRALEAHEGWQHFHHHQDTLARWFGIESAFVAWLGEWIAALTAVGATVQQPRLSEPRLQRALAVLLRDPGLGPLPYDAMQAASGLSRPHLDRLLRAELGMTPRRWQERRTLTEAQRLLREEASTVQQIAAALRFTDASHFARWFRKHTGQAPLAWRRGHGGV